MTFGTVKCIYREFLIVRKSSSVSVGASLWLSAWLSTNAHINEHTTNATPFVVLLFVLRNTPVLMTAPELDSTSLSYCKDT